MKVEGTPTRTIWVEALPARGRPGRVGIIDQTRLPHDYATVALATLDDAANAIADMLVRGAPLIGATAAYGVALALHGDASDARLAHARDTLLATRPTAINLAWALDRMRRALAPLPEPQREAAAWAHAAAICDEDVEINRMIGVHGLPLIRDIAARKRGPVNILTHCNAGWLATVDWGTATAPIYQAHDAGIPVHVWVDETRPRNQGAALTAWELGNHGVPHTVVTDNAGGHLMQRGLVDLVITGTDRTTASGDVCNKIGTYLKALAAADNGVPFYVALPSPTIDFRLDRGADVPIEERSADEVTWVHGRDPQGRVTRVRVTPEGSPTANPAFDVTPARLVTGLVTEKGVVAADRAAIAALFPGTGRGVTDLAERQAIIATCLRMNAEGLNTGTSGNVSVRVPGGMLVTPSGVPYAETDPAQIVHVAEDGTWSGDWRPSSEWRMHLAIYGARPEAQAVVHVHSPHATALACLRRAIPAFHYMVAVAGGTDIRCAEYATFGTQELSDAMLAALDGRSACLLANHGQIAFGPSLGRALWLASEVEALARQLIAAETVGAPVILPDDEMARVLARFADYGRQPARGG